MIIFKSKQKKLEGDLKIKLCGKRLYPTESVKYLGELLISNQGISIPVHYSRKISILEFQDEICLENILFVSKSLNNLSPSIFNIYMV